MRSNGAACCPCWGSIHTARITKANTGFDSRSQSADADKNWILAEVINIPMADRLTLPRLSAPVGGAGAASAIRAHNGQ